MVRNQGAAGAAHEAASKAISDWDTFYDGTLQPAFRFIGAFLVIAVALAIASALTSRFFVRVDAVVWPGPAQRCARALGSVLILGAAALLPFYGMFQPFQAADVEGWWSWGVLATVGTLFAGLCVWAYFSTTDWRHFAKDWWLPPAVVAAIIGVAVLATSVLLGAMGEDTPWRRLCITYVALLALGIVITATSSGQRCRLEVGVQDADGRPYASATGYLLGRLRTLGKEQTRGIDMSDLSSLPTSLSSLEQQDLSGIPGNQVAATLMRFWATLRPDLTWRAQITFVDDDRLAMRLLRNGRLARASIFSRSDLGLNPLAEDGSADGTSKNLAKAQLLTGAAAFIVTELSHVHPSLEEGLCGATEWRSVTLQVIATSTSLARHEDASALLRKASNMDPGNAIARYEYVRRLEEQLHEPYDATILGMYEALRDEAYAGGCLKRGWGSLYLSALYRASNATLRRCVRGGKYDPFDGERADGYAEELERACKVVLTRPRPDDEIAAKARSLLPFAQKVRSIVTVLNDGPWSESGGMASPVLAYNSACLNAHAIACLPPTDARKHQIEVALIRDLAFATGTEEAKRRAQTDPDLSSVRGDERFMGLVKHPSDFVGFGPFAPFRAQLTTAGLTTPARFARATRTGSQRQQTALYLATLPATIDRLHGIAALGEVHPDFDDADMLRLLTGLGVESPSQLRERMATDAAFPENLKDAAVEQGLEYSPGVQRLFTWMAAVRVTG
ncbi:hypothetical protein [Catenulispora subtropica]|uniref:Uncharacterized protein n=1 Tax=Catenulispora subtropica TaxID=450798 RepID=A0ABN2RMC9_9ACTN